MGNVQVQLYDKQGFPRNWELPWCIYGAFAEGDASTVFVKIGTSSKVYDRLLILRTSCPYRIPLTVWSHVASRGVAQALESDIAEQFASRGISNNWFRFDTESPEDKMAFYEVTKMLFIKHTGVAPAWRNITAEQLDAYASLKKK